MAVERIISPESLPEETEPTETTDRWSLRPRRLDEYIGQPTLIEKLRIAITAAKQRSDPMEHTLLHGPPGLGKTTLAHVISNEMESQVHVTSGPALTRPGDLVGILTRLQHGDVLFIDEIHRLPAAVEECLYSAMEDFRIDVPIDSGMHARSIVLTLKPFSLIGATTRAGLVSAPLRSRFGIVHHLNYYSDEELSIIAERSARLLEIDSVAPDAIESLSRLSRGTPRIVNRLLRRVRDYAQVENNGRVDTDVTRKALHLEGIDDLGLDPLDRQYLEVIAKTYDGGPVGLDAVAATLNEDARTLEDVVEPFLLKIGFVARTRRGRQLTADGASYLGVSGVNVLGSRNDDDGADADADQGDSADSGLFG